MKLLNGFMVLNLLRTNLVSAKNKASIPGVGSGGWGNDHKIKHRALFEFAKRTVGPVSPDGSCGPGSKDYYTCTGSDFGHSCNDKGQCGTGKDFSGHGCQGEWGYCDPADPPSTLTTATSSTQETPPTPTDPSPTGSCSNSYRQVQGLGQTCPIPTELTDFDILSPANGPDGARNTCEVNCSSRSNCVAVFVQHLTIDGTPPMEVGFCYYYDVPLTTPSEGCGTPPTPFDYGAGFNKGSSSCPSTPSSTDPSTSTTIDSISTHPNPMTTGSPDTTSTEGTAKLSTDNADKTSTEDPATPTAIQPSTSESDRKDLSTSSGSKDPVRTNSSSSWGYGSPIPSYASTTDKDAKDPSATNKDGDPTVTAPPSKDSTTFSASPTATPKPTGDPTCTIPWPTPDPISPSTCDTAQTTFTSVPGLSSGCKPLDGSYLALDDFVSEATIAKCHDACANDKDCEAYFYDADGEWITCRLYHSALASPAADGAPCATCRPFSEGANRVCTSDVDTRCRDGSTYTTINSLTGEAIQGGSPPCSVPAGAYDHITLYGGGSCEDRCNGDGSFCEGYFAQSFKSGPAQVTVACYLYHGPIDGTCTPMSGPLYTTGSSKNCFCKKN